MKLTLLGTGTPSPSLKRAGSGYMVSVGKDLMLWDHGPGTHHRLLQLGKRAVDVTHMIFSHLHYDHCVDFIRLFLNRWDQGAGHIPELKIYGPTGLKHFMERLFGEDGAFAADLRARIEHQGSVDVFVSRGGKPPRKRPQSQITEVHPGDVIRGDGWTITFAVASHVQPYLECYGLRLEAEGKSICYSGDSGGITPTIVDLAKNADVLIHMNHYMSGTEPTEIYRQVCGNPIDTAHVAQQARAKLLVLTHMLEQIDQPGIREDILKQMSRIYDGPIIWGEDLMEIPIDGPALAKME